MSNVPIFGVPWLPYDGCVAFAGAAGSATVVCVVIGLFVAICLCADVFVRRLLHQFVDASRVDFNEFAPVVPAGCAATGGAVNVSAGCAWHVGGWAL
jgi:hypothetical protein